MKAPCKVCELTRLLLSITILVVISAVITMDLITRAG